MNPFPNDVFLRESDHTYWSKKTGMQFISVSALKGNFKKKFDKDKMLPLSAKKDLIKAGLHPDQITTKQIQDQMVITEKRWDSARTDSADHGTGQHKALEDYFTTTQLQAEHAYLLPMVQAVARLINQDKPYYATYNEVTFYSELYHVAGTADKPCFRTATKKSVLDIFDYKTYLKKGMQYKSDYTEFFYPPIQHLENCNFNEAALQLSIYGVMAEEHGFKIGRLGVIFIPPQAPDCPQMIPVNYMREEAIAILKLAPTFIKDNDTNDIPGSDDDF